MGRTVAPLAPVGASLEHFDHAAALAAAELCERAAKRVADLDQQRHGLATRATADGSGPWLAQFDRSLAEASIRSAATQRSLLQAADALRAASHAARASGALGTSLTQAPPTCPPS